MREDLGSVITALPAIQSLSVEVMFFWRVMGKNWSERSIYKAGTPAGLEVGLKHEFVF